MQTHLLVLSVVSLLAGVIDVRAADGGVKVALTGIAHFNKQVRALFELSGPGTRGITVKPVLFVGERVGKVEVRDINAQTGSVRILNDGEESVLSLNGKPSASLRTFHFKAADSAQLIEVYQALAGRTVLRSPTLPGFKYTGQTESLSTEDALRFLESAFLGKGVILDQRGDKFVIAVRSGVLEPLAFIGDPAKEPAPPGANGEQNVLPAGQIKFQDADPVHVLEIYQELTGRTVLRPSNLRGGRVTVLTQTALTRAEAVWMLGAALSLSDITMLPEGEKFVFALSGAKAPVAPIVKSDSALTIAPGRGELPAGGLKFSSAEGRQALGTYAHFVGRRPAESVLPAVRFQVRSQTALTAEEVRFVFEALAALNQVQFVPVGNDQVTLASVAVTRSDTP